MSVFVRKCGISLVMLAALICCPNSSAKVGFRQLLNVHPVAVQRGTEQQVQMRCNFTLDDTYAVFFDRPGITMTYAETEPIEAPRKNRAFVGTPFRFDVSIPDDQPTGVYELRAATKKAVSSISHLLVTDYPVVLETDDDNDQPQSAQPVSVPAAVCGVCAPVQDVDCYQFTGVHGQKITAQVYAQRVTERIHIMLVKHPVYHMNPILTILGPSGQVVAENDNYYGGDPFVHCELPEDGIYTVRIRDVRYAGSEKYSYCLELSERPFLKSVFPLAVQAGTSTAVIPVGYGFDDTSPIEVRAVADAAAGWNPVRYESGDVRTNEASVLTSLHPQYAAWESSDSIESAVAIEMPCGVSGRISAPDGTQYFGFDAQKGQRYSFEVEAFRRGLPLDAVIEVLNADGKVLAEIDDTRGSPYAGFWVQKDGTLRFAAPADGRFYVSVRDLHGRGGADFVYYLRAIPDGPDFELYGEYYYAMLAPGTRMLWFAHINRLNGFDGPVTLGIEGLPAGVDMTPATIPAGMNDCAVILSAAEDASIDAGLVRIFGKATVMRHEEPQEIVRYGHITCELQQGGGSSQFRWPCETQIVGVTEPLDLATVEATPTEVTLEPGGRAEIHVRIVRNEGSEDPATLAMSHMYYTNSSGDQLPPGVTLSSDSRTQLKAGESEATIVLEASKDALPVENLPIAVMVRVYVTYNISTNYASTPISLSVSKSK